MPHLFRLWGYWLFGFAGTGVGRGRDVRRFTRGEENDATEHKALTLPNRKVTARRQVNSSC
jgi:hypothetical protein